MKPILAALLVAAAALATAPTFANDVESVIPAAPAGTAAPSIAYTGVPAHGFGNADISSVIPALPAAEYGSVGSSSPAASQPYPFGNEDITSVLR